MKNQGSISIQTYYAASVCSAFNNIKPHLTRICCLQLHLDSVQLSLEPVLGARVNHLAPHFCGLLLPCNEENPALWDIFCSHKIKIKDSISALISRETCCKFIVSLCWFPKLFHNHLLLLLFDFINDEAKGPLCLQIHEL
ncbi:hypothetical protein Ccrd_016731 [Cynara cardunculus var. scolymus]|uniref:Uncharacterized protein n=1 Tax=Cynara cardunculus var. scolymus TaxID=59895 RepID=A0A103Y9D2_CYNCS|nr:hypothetical protein Ccrd_016731 [Cynara cardunculus var. scolymus]